jgi:hypothetical protein
VNSVTVKTAALCYWRFAKRYMYIATEVGAYNADLMACNGKDLVEVEVKVSRSDLARDFDKHKHLLYARPAEPTGSAAATARSRAWVPNRFYFAVPELLEAYALEKISASNQKYGLLVVGDGRVDQSVRVSKTAGKLHSEPVQDESLRKIMLRTTSDLAHFYLRQELHSEMLSKMLEASKQVADWEAEDGE